MDDLEARIAELRGREELESIRPDLDGQAVMAHLGLAPGREVGEALAMLLEARLEEGPLGEAEAYARLDAWWAARADAAAPLYLGHRAQRGGEAPHRRPLQRCHGFPEAIGRGSEEREAIGAEIPHSSPQAPQNPHIASRWLSCGSRPEAVGGCEDGMGAASLRPLSLPGAELPRPHDERGGEVGHGVDPAGAAGRGRQARARGWCRRGSWRGRGS